MRAGRESAEVFAFNKLSELLAEGLYGLNFQNSRKEVAIGMIDDEVDCPFQRGGI